MDFLLKNVINKNTLMRLPPWKKFFLYVPVRVKMETHPK